MSTFTVCFCGTSCWPDEGIKSRDGNGGSNKTLFSPVAGYIPARIYSELAAPYRKAVIPGPGTPYFNYWRGLWVPCTVSDPFELGDTALGGSMWDLAGHAAARVVGIPSSGRAAGGLIDANDAATTANLNTVETQIGAKLHPSNKLKPPSNERYQWSPELIEALAGSQHGNSRYGKITVINLIGHSRGAVGAIMCSHELSALFPSATINIFAIDPVPGAGTTSTEMTTLGSRVKNYVAVYALDETSNGFNGVVPWPKLNGVAIDPLAEVANQGAQIKVPNYHLVYVRGRHGTVSGNRTDKGNSNVNEVSSPAVQVSNLVNALARACLRRWGTDIVDSPNQPPLQTMKQAMTQNDALFLAMRSERYDWTGPLSPTQLEERGVSSTEGSNPLAWSYLEDVIGGTPIVPRGMVRDAVRRGPGRVKWYALQNVKDEVFTSALTNYDTDFSYGS